MKRARRLFAGLCVAMLVLSTLPLYAISFYNHPYYDDFSFAAPMHHVWKATGSVRAVLTEAFRAAARTRQTWQGTYTGTFLSNLQPGLFSEGLYWIGSWFLLTALIVCTAFFLCTAFEKLGLERWARVSLSSLAVMVIVQFMPDVGEAFFWFNGGIGNTGIYAMFALAAGLCIRLYHCQKRGIGLTAGLAVLAIALGGGSYGGGLFGPAALLSIVKGEAAQYDREMSAREELLNDDSQPVITLRPISKVPLVFMEDLAQPDAVYDVHGSLCVYYGKQAIHIEGEEAEP